MNSQLPRLGRRGEGWVAPQPVLIAALVAAGMKGPRWPAGLRGLRLAAAGVSAAAGLYLFSDGIARLATAPCKRGTP